MKNLEKKLIQILPTLLPSLKVVSWEGKSGQGKFVTRQEEGGDADLIPLSEKWGFIRGWKYSASPMRWEYIGDDPDPSVKLNTKQGLVWQPFKTVGRIRNFYHKIFTDFQEGETFALRGRNGAYATFSQPITAQEWLSQNRDAVENLQDGQSILVARAETKAQHEYSCDFDQITLEKLGDGFALVIKKHKHEGAGFADGSYRRWAVTTEIPI